MIFQKSTNQSAFLKAGIMGFAGSGKSRTSAEIAVGLSKHTGNKPVFYLDTETGSDFLKPLFDKEGIELFVSKSRAFKDLLSAVDEAEGQGAILIIDSISHFWNELMEAFKKKKKLKFSKKEFDILKYFINRKGEVVSRNDLLDAVWGYETAPVTRTIDTFISRIRKKIEDSPSRPKYLKSIRNAGYKLEID